MVVCGASDGGGVVALMDGAAARGGDAAQWRRLQMARVMWWRGWRCWVA